MSHDVLQTEALTPAPSEDPAHPTPAPHFLTPAATAAMFGNDRQGVKILRRAGLLRPLRRAPKHGQRGRTFLAYSVVQVEQAAKLLESLGWDGVQELATLSATRAADPAPISPRRKATTRTPRRTTKAA